MTRRSAAVMLERVSERTIEQRVGDLEYALPVATILIARALCYTNGWNDDDLSGFMHAVADAVRNHQGTQPAPGVRDTPLLIHLEHMASGLGGEFDR